MKKIQENLLAINRRIEKAAVKSGRTRNDIILLGVSKTVDVPTAKIAYELGIRDFGENRVQEFAIKSQEIPEARWHMIGRLQTNKVKEIVGKTYLIHSMDRWRLAEELNKRAKNLGVEVPILLELNISGEEQKAGIKADEIETFLDSMGQLENVKTYGFMTMAPLCQNPENTRPVFRELNNIFMKLKSKKYTNVDLKYLSMGMSGDFEIAIEEGSNMVRIGTALFS